MLQDGHLWGVLPTGSLLSVSLPRTRLPASSIKPGLVLVIGTVPLVVYLLLRRLALLRLSATAHSMVMQCYYHVSVSGIYIR